MRIEVESGREVVAPSGPDALLVRLDARGTLVKSVGPLAEREPLDRFLSRVHEIIRAERGGTP
jgi:hypothetical protein